MYSLKLTIQYYHFTFYNLFLPVVVLTLTWFQLLRDQFRWSGL